MADQRPRIAIYLPEEQKKIWKSYADEKGQTCTEFVKRAVSAYISAIDLQKARNKQSHINDS